MKPNIVALFLQIFNN